jgi:predicted site-specific integrase-resolvase
VVIDDPLFNETEAAAYLGGLSVKTLQKWRWKGCGPEFVKPGSRVFYRRSALETYIAQRRRRSTSDHGQQ